MASVKQVRADAAELLGSGTAVLGAFLGIRGPRPGVEIFGGLAGTGVLLLTGSTWLFGITVGIVIAVVAANRRYYVVVRTADEVLLIDNGRRARLRPGGGVTRLPTNSISVSDAEGDPQATVGFMGLWLPGEHQDEARRLARLAPAA